MAQGRSGKRIKKQKSTVKIEDLADTEIRIRRDVGELRTGIKEFFRSSINTYHETQVDTNRRTLIGAVSTFYVMAAIFFFAGNDVFETLLISLDLQKIPDLQNTSLQHKRTFYYAAGVFETIAVFICAPAAFMGTRKVGSHEIRMIHLYVSTFFGIGTIGIIGLWLAFVTKI